MRRQVLSWGVAWIVATASAAVFAQTETKPGGADSKASAGSQQAQVSPAASEDRVKQNRPEGSPPPATEKAEPTEVKESPPADGPEGSETAAEKKAEPPPVEGAQPDRKPDPSAMPSTVFPEGRPRHFLARFHGEVIGRMIWDARTSPRDGGRFERAERDLLMFDQESKRFRFNYIERQLTKEATFETMWCTLRDVHFGGQFQLKGAGEDATTRLLTSEGGAPQDVPFPTPPDYHSMADVASWCAKYRGATGKTYTLRRPLWFSRSSDWGELAISPEGADPVLMEDGSALPAWRFRLRFTATPEVYALFWLDAEGRPVRRELPFCGLTFVGCSEGTYNDVAKVTPWHEAKSRWLLPDDRTTAEILFLVHDHLEKTRAEGSSWGGGLSPDETIGSEAEAEAKLGLFLFFL